MTQEQWFDLGWQLAGWLAVPALTLLVTYGVKLLRAHLSLKQWDAVERVTTAAVRAANQTIQANPEKKAWVLSVVQAWMNSHGIRLDATALEAQIESSVNTEKNWLIPQVIKPAPTDGGK